MTKKVKCGECVWHVHTTRNGRNFAYCADLTVTEDDILDNELDVYALHDEPCPKFWSIEELFQDAMRKEREEMREPTDKDITECNQPQNLNNSKTVNLKPQSIFPEELQKLLTREQKGNDIWVMPKQFLGAENFKAILKIAQSHKGKYVSAGKQSHFEIPT